MKNMRLHFLFIVVLLFSYQSLFSQCAGFSNVVITYDASCFGIADGSAYVNTLGGTPPYSYQWSNGSNDSIADSLSSGNYLVIITDSIACSDTFDFFINEPQEIIVDTIIEICDIDSFQVGNNYYSVSGLYNDTLISFKGCDSILGLELMLNPSYGFNEQITVCDSIIWNGVSYSQSGLYSLNLLTLKGCDSIFYLDLTINNISTSTQNIMSCDDLISPSGNYIWTNTGTYLDTIQNHLGCDSILTINYTKSPPISIVTSYLDPSCYNLNNGVVLVDSIFGGLGNFTVDWGGVDTNSLFAGNYTVLVTDSIGCLASESIVLTQPSQINISIDSSIAPCSNSLCNGYITYSVSGGSPSYTSSFNSSSNYSFCSGNYFLIVNDSVGCTDSVSFSIPNPISSQFASFDVDCFGANNGYATISSDFGNPPYTYLWSNGSNDTIIDLLTPGLYNLVISDAYSCSDSISFQINEPSQLVYIDTFSLCDGDSVFSGANFYSQQGVFVDTITSALGCDSIVTSNISILPLSYSSVVDTVCFIYEYNGISYTQSGIYTQVFTSSNGCDSILTLDLNIKQVDTSINDFNPTFYANAVLNATYQWLDCNAGFSLITGEVNQGYTATQNGSYAVEVTQNGCVDTSSCYVVSDIVSIGVLSSSLLPVLSPNPNSGLFKIDFNQIHPNVRVLIKSISGKIIYAENFTNSSSEIFSIDAESGIYFVDLSFGDTYQIILKVIKN